MSVALFTSQVLSQIKSGTLVILVYDRETVLQVVHNREHGFQKVLPCRGAQIATHTRYASEKPNQNPTRQSRQSDHRIQKYFRGPPHWATRNEASWLRDGLKVCGAGCKRLGTWKCDWAYLYRENTPQFLNNAGAPRTIVDKAIKHGISSG